MSETETLLLCYNKGCGKSFKEEENDEGVCTYHPGVPVFHDALKGWSCCPKRYRDFSDFLDIPGCAKGKHNPVKPVEPEKPKTKPLAVGEEIIVKAPLPKSREAAARERPPDDLPYTELKVKITDSLTSLLARLKVQEEEKGKEKTQEEETEDPDNVKFGTQCKNKGCSATFEGPNSNYQTCYYHPGFPIFHEGYKFWTCCQRRTSDFNEFLRQQGCSTGDHMWTGEKKPTVCSYDWHQTGAFVVVSVFAKACLPESCSFEANPTNIRLAFCFDNGKSEHELHIPLHGVIDPKRSSVELMGTKAEIKLRKADPISWAALHVGQDRQK